MKMLRPLSLVFASSLVALAVGCSKPKPATAPEAQPTPAPQAPVAQPVEAPAEVPRPRPTPVAETLPTSVDEINRKGYLKDVFFDLDQDSIRADGRDALAANAEWLKKWSGVKLRIEGHCDERGTGQYNLALGERRASATRDYLVSLGIDSARMEIVSYGKERPFVEGHDESSWSQNRRGHFVVTAK